MADDRKALIESGWQQFCILCPSDYDSLCELAHIDINPDDLLLVVTQTCDLVSDVKKEPYFEVICLRPLDRPPSGDHLHGKNSRRLELTLDIPGIPQNYWFIQAYERFFVRHEILKDISPIFKIDDDITRNLLIDWITKRYNRTAFPEAFEQRWKERKKQIEGIIRQFELVQDIYIRMEPFGEIDAVEEYKVEIILLMDADDFDNPETHKEYSVLCRQLEDHFNSCAGIDIEVINLRSNADISIKEIQSYKRWDFDYFSYRDPESHAFPNID